MPRIAIWIPGQPARVTHQSGTRYLRHGGTYKTQALKDWEAKLTQYLRRYIPDKPIDGPVLLRVTFGYKATKKADLWKWKITRPDTDNSIKTIKDVMSKLKFWNDDAQVTHEICKKMWVDQPGLIIIVEELDREIFPATIREWKEDL